MSEAEARVLALPVRPTTADEWAARMRCPDVSEQDHTEFLAWLKADPANPRAYDECSTIWVVSNVMRSKPEFMRESRAALARASVGPWMRKRRIGRWATAASAAVIAIAVAALVPNLPRDGIQAATRKGEQRTIALHDGSTIQLNTDTVVSYRVSEKARRVELRHGEAFFDVAKDPVRPFIVKVGKSEVRVVGTKFTVRQDADGLLQVTVKQGRVDVVTDAVALTTGTPQRVELTSGDSLRLDADEQRIRVATVDTDRAMAWRTGSLDFDESTLEQVVAELNRYVEKPFVIEDDSIRGIPMTGRVRVIDLDSIRYMLRETFYIESRPHGDRIALRGVKR